MDEERKVISDLFEILKSRGTSGDLAPLYHAWTSSHIYFPLLKLFLLTPSFLHLKFIEVFFQDIESYERVW